jgi:hypothetical protein
MPPLLLLLLCGHDHAALLGHMHMFTVLYP